MLVDHIVGSDNRHGGLQSDRIRNIPRVLAPRLGVQFELRQDPPMASECDWFSDLEIDEFRATVPVFVGDHPRRCLLRKTLGGLSIFPSFADLGQGLAGVACIPLQFHGLGAAHQSQVGQGPETESQKQTTDHRGGRVAHFRKNALEGDRERVGGLGGMRPGGNQSPGLGDGGRKGKF